MKVLIIGPSGSGKTYISTALQQKGINAFDGDQIPDLENWYDQQGNKVPEPKTAQEALDNHYAFLWSKKAMRRFLAQHDDVYVFGGSGNASSLFELFDKVYFLQIGAALQTERLRSPLRPTPLMDADKDGPVIWGKWLEEMAREKNVPFIDADQTPEKIYEQIRLS